MGNIDYNTVNQSSKKFKKRKYDRSHEPFLCVVCKKVWQYTEGYLYQEYLVDFPTYGCNRNICKRCKQ